MRDGRGGILLQDRGPVPTPAPGQRENLLTGSQAAGHAAPAGQRGRASGLQTGSRLLSRVPGHQGGPGATTPLAEGRQGRKNLVIGASEAPSGLRPEAGRVSSANSWALGSSSECQHLEPGRPLALLCSFLGWEVVRPRGCADAHPGPRGAFRDLCPLRDAFQASPSVGTSCSGESPTVRDGALSSGAAGPGSMPAHAAGLRAGSEWVAPAQG